MSNSTRTINTFITFIFLCFLGAQTEWDCSSDSDCGEGSFCAIECFTGGCGDGSVEAGTVGQFCQPCDECQMLEDSISGNCDACGGVNDEENSEDGCLGQCCDENGYVDNDCDGVQTM